MKVSAKILFLNPSILQKDKKEEKAQDLKIESLDDLFDEEPQEKKKQEVEPIKTLDLNDFEEPAPVLPQENDDDSYDLQKELEAKFDELFGPIDKE